MRVSWNKIIESKRDSYNFVIIQLKSYPISARIGFLYSNMIYEDHLIYSKYECEYNSSMI